MAANRRVSDKELVAALKKWEGNVAAVAEQVGMARNNVYERISALNLNADDFRRKHNGTYRLSEGDGTGCTESDTVTRPPTVVRFEGASSRQAGAGHTLGAMNAQATDEKRQAGPIRLRPDQLRLLREFKFDFMAKHRTEASEADLLQQFFDTLFPEYQKQALAEKKAKA